MTDLTRGANAALNGGSVELAVTGARQGSVDLMVLQLGPDRKVRSDNDFVFFNQPTSPEGAVRLLGAARMQIDLAGVPAAVETLAVAVALDDGVPGSLAAIPGLGVTITAGPDRHLAAAAGLTVERAAVLVEVYRRAGGWKVRNVSAGWAAGLPALAREHGVSVEDTPASSPAPPPTPAARPAPAPDYLPPAVLPAGRPAAGPPSTAYPAGSSASAYPAGPPSVAYPAASSAGYPAAGNSGYPASTQSGRPAAPPTAGHPPPPIPAPGGWPPPGGSLPPPPPLTSVPAPGGWPPPGGDLRPAELPPPTNTGRWTPPGSR